MPSRSGSIQTSTIRACSGSAAATADVGGTTLWNVTLLFMAPFRSDIEVMLKGNQPGLGSPWGALERSLRASGDGGGALMRPPSESRPGDVAPFAVSSR